ncbi:DctP family TRAP transporter solute-binding subunit [bacterium]|nr:DctP family TRAP transporter solute-binding subunit [bacterium]
MKKRWILLVGIFITIALFIVTTPAMAAKYTIKIVHNANMADEDYDGAMVFKDFVESHSNGQIMVEIYPGTQLCGNARECMESIQAGILEVYITTIGGFSNLYPEAQVLDLPYMFRDDRTAECVFDGPYVEELRRDVLKKLKNVRLMVIGNTGGWRNFATVKKQIRTPDDVKGQKLRTINSDIQIEMVKLLGGNPTGIAWAEVYTSLATGVVEGSKNGITDIVGMKFHEHIKYMTLDGHAYMAALWMMNDNLFQSLPLDLRKVVVDGFINLRQVVRAYPKRRQISAYEEFKKSGGTIYVPTAAEKKMFQDAVAPMRKWFTDKYGTKALDQLNDHIKACERQIDAAYAIDTK